MNLGMSYDRIGDLKKKRKNMAHQPDSEFQATISKGGSTEEVRKEGTRLILFFWVNGLDLGLISALEFLSLLCTKSSS